MMMMMMRWLYVAESIGVRLPQDVCFPSSHISTIHAISLSDLMFMMTVMVMMMVMVLVMILIKEYSCRITNILLSIPLCQWRQTMLIIHIDHTLTNDQIYNFLDGDYVDHGRGDHLQTISQVCFRSGRITSSHHQLPQTADNLGREIWFIQAWIDTQ